MLSFSFSFSFGKVFQEIQVSTEWHPIENNKKEATCEDMSQDRQFVKVVYKWNVNNANTIKMINFVWIIDTNHNEWMFKKTMLISTCMIYLLCQILCLYLMYKKYTPTKMLCYSLIKTDAHQLYQ